MRARSFVAVGCWIFLSTSLHAQFTGRISVPVGGGQGNGDCSHPSMTPDGRFVAYSSMATNIAPPDGSVYSDVYVYDRLRGITRVASLADGNTSNGYSGFEETPAISADGRFVAFTSDASNLVLGDTNGKQDAFVRDMEIGRTERVSISTSGLQANGHCHGSCSISDDGRYVAFCCSATNLVPDVYGGLSVSHIYVRDRRRGTTEIIDVDLIGLPPLGHSFDPSVSADGRFVAFSSDDDYLVRHDTNRQMDVFVRDRTLGDTQLVSVTLQGDSGGHESKDPSISEDGRHVVFFSGVNDLVAGNPDAWGIFIRDLASGTTGLVAPAALRYDLDYGSTFGPPVVTSDGRYVAFSSVMPHLVPEDTNGLRDVFVVDRSTGTTERVSLAWNGAQSDAACSILSRPAISAEGRFVAFEGLATNLVPLDTNGHGDVFIRDRRSNGFTSVCEPGSAGVAACPCANPPSGPGRGCDNSAGTGGASITAAGDAYLTHDSLVFTTAGEGPGATSILFESGGFVPGGTPYGRGVDCLGGVPTKLYTRTASGGGIRVPDSAVNDLGISDLSTQLGHGITAGRSRYYAVLYRDPVPAATCGAPTPFNLTQTARIDWSF
jgi:Tol biopolymer transport system component